MIPHYPYFLNRIVPIFVVQIFYHFQNLRPILFTMGRLDYQTFSLDNGLKVIVHEDHSIPKVVMDIVYRVGAKDEDPEKTGFAHLFEHLMFGGSKNIPSYDAALQQVGGDNNAFTNNDITNYYISLPSNQLETGFWLESDRMLELDFSPKSLDVQKSVVIEEFKQRYLNQPYGDAHLILRDVHYTTHPYRWPTIGKDISHIEAATLEDVKEFFYGFYAPNNATLVVAGDVKTEEVKRLAEKWFGPIPRRELIQRDIPTEPKQTAPRSKTVYKEVPYPAVYKMYHIPARMDDRYYAADIITDLFYGRASLLNHHMVRNQQVATSVRAFSWSAHHPGCISIDGTVAEGKTVEEYETALQEVIDNLANLKEEELQRVKNSIEAYHIGDRTTFLNRAISLAINDVLGDPELTNTILDKYMAITLDEVKAAAVEYLDPSNCSTLYYLPGNGKQ